jgi:hypothetical protein
MEKIIAHYISKSASGFQKMAHSLRTFTKFDTKAALCYHAAVY